PDAPGGRVRAGAPRPGAGARGGEGRAVLEPLAERRGAPLGPPGRGERLRDAARLRPDGPGPVGPPPRRPGAGAFGTPDRLYVRASPGLRQLDAVPGPGDGAGAGAGGAGAAAGGRGAGSWALVGHAAGCPTGARHGIEAATEGKEARTR